MKTNILILLLLLLSGTGFSQKAMYEYTGRNTPFVKKEKLKEARTISDLTPELWQKIAIPYKEREELERRRKTEYSLGYLLYPQGGYNAVVEYVSIEISAFSKGKLVSAQSKDEQLTEAQKNMLSSLESDADINIKIKFKYKNYVDENRDVDLAIKEGNLTVAVIPETEAQYPGGFKQLTTYLTEAVFKKLTEQSAAHNIAYATVKFTVNEQGHVANAYLLQTSGDYATDKLILDAITKMPAWKPAKNAKGVSVKQEFSIPFGEGGGC
ncbi:MAG: hypothetical protein JWP12_3208 [Bacteroidetes bacterium]|nr:hypothetical protein [Bacteroidota bacterium]